MKLKALFLALAVAGAGASFALADDSGGSTTTGTTASTAASTTTSDGCRRFHLSGTLASVSASSFSGHGQEGQRRRQVVGRLGLDDRRHRPTPASRGAAAAR